jgi:GT2 family glycosyltransferase
MLIRSAHTPDRRPPLSAIIPTYNALRYLPACLAALRAQLSPDDEIILVDNASLDHAGDWARQYAPDVRVLTLDRNHGFAGGTNAGLRAAHHDLLLLINDDALAEPGCIEQLWSALRNNPDAGSAAGVLTFSRHPQIVASAGIMVRRDGVATDAYAGVPTTALPDQPAAVFGASGGLMLMRRVMLDDIGDFAEEFFNYLEDVDHAWRARLRGWSSVLAPKARARHVYSATGTQNSPFKQRLLARNRLRVIIRCFPAALLRDCLPAILAYDMLVVAYACFNAHRQLYGRLEGLKEIPMLLKQRRQIQARRSAHHQRA